MEALLLSEDEENVSNSVLRRPAEIDSVTVPLQAKEKTLRDVHAMFDGVATKYSNTEDCLGRHPLLVTDPMFDSAIVDKNNER